MPPKGEKKGNYTLIYYITTTLKLKYIFYMKIRQSNVCRRYKHMACH